MAPRVFAVATMDTKADELEYIAQLIKKAGCTCELLDVSCSVAPTPGTVERATISRALIAASHPEGEGAVLGMADRAEALGAMSLALKNFVTSEAAAKRFDGIVGIGGSGGTSLITPAMQALPVGFPKLMVTTMASGNVAPYVGCADVTLMPSVADVAGLNSISRAVLSNAAGAIVGMVRSPPQPPRAKAKSTIAMSMFGVTTPCCDAVRRELEAEYEVVTFHATGAGGRALEKLAADGLLAGVLDLTTTEVADEVVGGVLSAGPTRLDALSALSLPAVVSVGALDMVNFGARNTVPPAFEPRQLHVHNAQVTLMRTTADELASIGHFLATKLNKAAGPLALLLPTGGLSAIDAPGMPFEDVAARQVLFETLEAEVATRASPSRRVLRVNANINDAAFATAAIDAFRALMAEAGPTQKAAAAPPPTPALPLPRDLPPAGTGPRDEVLAALRAVLAAGHPIIGAGAGTGISAKFEEEGGADLIIVYNSGRFRMSGHGSLAGMLPFKDANAVMLEMGGEIAPVLKHAPLLAGVCATDPFRSIDRLLLQVKELGFAGVQNFPTVGLIDGSFRQNLEETGMGYAKEVAMVAAARRLGLLTTPYVFDVEQARLMAAAGADVVVAHMGLTTKGSIGATTSFTLDESVIRVQAIADAAAQVNPQVLVLTHGGPISMPEDAQYVQARVRGVHGFYGASSMERLPVETAITQQMRAFKNMAL